MTDLQERESIIERPLRRFFEPPERLEIVFSPACELQDGSGELEATGFGAFGFPQARAFGLGPEATAGA